MSSQSEQINPRLGRNAKPGEMFNLRFMCFNIANAERDEKENPLLGRLDEIIQAIKDVDPPIDAFVLLEANRPSQGKSWSSIAAEIEEATGYRYQALHILNGSNNPFGKALFVNPDTLICKTDQQSWTEKKDVWSGGYWGNAVSCFALQPLVTEEVQLDPNPEKPPAIIRRVILDKQIRLGAVHFPMGRFDRMKVSDWLNAHYDDADIWMGDYNTFPDDGGDEMITRISAHRRLTHCDLGVPFTFKAFPHDLITKPSSFHSQMNEHSSVESEGVDKDGNPTINVRFASTLDHVFYHPGNFELRNAFALPLTPASDHARVIVDVSI
jgi:endonuclease/exonuclease/phosphatase family metal-dependent hydrolase